MPAKASKMKTPAANYMKGRPTLYKGIRMRSRLEADYAAYLDRKGRTWKYEPDCFADEGNQWLPDFRVDEPAGHFGRKHLVELKPAEMLRIHKDEQPDDVITRVDTILERVRPAWRSEPESSTDIIFWRYGASEPDLSVVGALDKPWAAWVPGFPIPFLWIGARQAELIGLFREAVTEHAQRIWADGAEEDAGAQ